MKFNKKFEEEILAQALRNVVYLRKATRILDSHHFNTKQHSWVWEIIRDIWKRHKEKMSVSLFLSRIKSDFEDREERVLHLKLVKKLYRKKIKNPEATLEELSKFVRGVNAQITMERAAKKLEKGDVDEVYKHLKKLVKNDLQPREYTEIKWIEEFKKRQKERKWLKRNPNAFKRIPTGIRAIDKIMGGLQTEELGLVLATTHKGKSIVLNNFAQHAIFKGFSVAYFAFEMPARQVAMRQDSRWLKMYYNKFKNFNFKPSELKEIKRRLKKVEKKWATKYRIFSIPVRKGDVELVKTILDNAKQDDGFEPDELLFDSGDHLKSVDKFKDFRLSQSAVYWDLKALAEEDGYAIWSSAHAAKEWADKVATAEAPAESYDKAKIADCILSLNTPKRKTRSTKITLDFDDEENQNDISLLAKGNYIEMFLAKYRDGVSRISIPLDAQFSKMIIREIQTED